MATCILGIDPGLHVTGYGVIEGGPPHVVEAGIISTGSGSKTKDIAVRLALLYNGIVEVIEQFQPEAVAVEQLYAHYKHPRTAILMAHARGTVLLAAALKELPVVSYNATTVKKTIAGNGRASKEQIQRTVAQELGLTKLPEPVDVTDALAVALCHHYLSRSRLSAIR